MLKGRQLLTAKGGKSAKQRFAFDMDIFAIRLKEIRIESGCTQKQLAAAIKTTDDSIYSWEKGRSQPSIEMLRALCKVFDVSADYLLGLEDKNY